MVNILLITERITSNELKNKFNNYLDTFFKLLNSNKKVLFIHTHEEYIIIKNPWSLKMRFIDICVTSMI